MFDQNISKLLQECIHIIQVFFVLSFLLSLNVTIESKVNEIGSEIMFGNWLIVFENGYVFSIWLFRYLPLLFLFHVDLLRME